MKTSSFFCYWSSPKSGQKNGLNLMKAFFFSLVFPKSGQKNGLNLGEDLFFFCWSSPKSGQKHGLNLREDLFLFNLYYSQISWPLPPFENIAHATEPIERVFLLNMSFQVFQSYVKNIYTQNMNDKKSGLMLLLL